MSKRRFTDTGKWSQVWFRGLSPDSKLVFFYLLDCCDDAGFWEEDKDALAFYTRLSVDAIDGAIRELVSCERIEQRSKGFIWIPKFISFQYPNGIKKKFNPHKSIYRSLKKHGLDEKSLYKNEGLTKACPTLQEIEIDIDKEIELDKGVLGGRRNGRN